MAKASTAIEPCVATSEELRRLALSRSTQRNTWVVRRRLIGRWLLWWGDKAARYLSGPLLLILLPWAVLNFFQPPELAPDVPAAAATTDQPARNGLADQQPVKATRPAMNLRLDFEADPPPGPVSFPLSPPVSPSTHPPSLP